MTDTTATSNFKFELKELLKKYGVEITLEEFSHGYYSEQFINFYAQGHANESTGEWEGVIDFNADIVAHDLIRER